MCDIGLMCETSSLMSLVALVGSDCPCRSTYDPLTILVKILPGCLWWIQIGHCRISETQEACLVDPKLIPIPVLSCHFLGLCPSC